MLDIIAFGNAKKREFERKLRKNANYRQNIILKKVYLPITAIGFACVNLFPLVMTAGCLICVICVQRNYNTFSTCSFICSSSSFIRTTSFCISLWFDLEPRVFTSRPISCAMNPNFLPGDFSCCMVSVK